MDDIQLLMLETNQFFNNPNRPVTGNSAAAAATYSGPFAYAGTNGTATVVFTQQTSSQIAGQIGLYNSAGQSIGTGTFSGASTGTNAYAGTISGIPGGPAQFNLTTSGTQVSGTLSGPSGTGTFGPLTRQS